MSEYVRLDRNMTEKRLPGSIKDATQIRVIIFEFDANSGAKSVMDIVDYPTKFAIHFFNANRQYYLEKGCEAMMEKIN